MYVGGTYHVGEVGDGCKVFRVVKDPEVLGRVVALLDGPREEEGAVRDEAQQDEQPEEQGTVLVPAVHLRKGERGKSRAGH